MAVTVDVGVMVAVYAAVGVSDSVAVSVIVGAEVSVKGAEVAVNNMVVGVGACSVEGVQAATINKNKITNLDLISCLQKFLPNVILPKGHTVPRSGREPMIC